MDKKDFNKQQNSNDSPINISLGLCIGVLVGVAIDNIGLGMLLGVALGLCIYPLFNNKKDK